MSTKTLNIVTVGHIDHGKSTVLGRLLSDTGSLGVGKLEQVKANCEKNSKPFEYAFLIDALKDEQSQGITIDAARIFFKTKKRNYLFLDAPGHIEFLRNMVTGASKADAALLVIDAQEGIQENSKRHAFLLSMLGIKQIAVVVSKMDLIKYSQKKFKSIVSEYKTFLKSIGLEASIFIPVSGIKGDNIVKKSKNLSWYKEKTLLGVIEFFTAEKDILSKSFRMPVQDIYKFTNSNDKRRLIAGTILSGKIKVGDEIQFYPSGKKTTVNSIERFNAPLKSEAVAGEAIGITLKEQIYLTRGEIAISDQTPLPQITTRIRTSIFWLGKQPMEKDKEYIFKLGTSKVIAQIESIIKIVDTSNLKETRSKEEIEKNYMAECILQLSKPVAADSTNDFLETSRFVLVDDYHICGGGIILEALKDESSAIRDKVILRNDKWIKSMISHSEREKIYGQSSAIIFITGKKDSGRKSLAKALELSLFKKQRLVYFFGIGNILYGVDSDIKGHNNNKQEHLRRLSEVCHLMLEAGMILIVTAIELSKHDIKLMDLAIKPEKVKTIWIGKKVTTDIIYDLKIDNVNNITKSVKAIENLLSKNNPIKRQLNKH